MTNKEVQKSNKLKKMNFESLIIKGEIFGKNIEPSVIDYGTKVKIMGHEYIIHTIKWEPNWSQEFGEYTGLPGCLTLEIMPIHKWKKLQEVKS